MTIDNAASAAYIVAALLFILALAGLSRHETVKAGNAFGMAGMVVALVATVGLAIDRDIDAGGLSLLVGAMVIGAAIGLWRSRQFDDRDAAAGCCTASSEWQRWSSGGTATSTSRPTRSAQRRGCSRPRNCWESTPPRSSSACSSAR